MFCQISAYIGQNKLTAVFVGSSQAPPPRVGTCLMLSSDLFIGSVASTETDQLANNRSGQAAVTVEWLRLLEIRNKFKDICIRPPTSSGEPIPVEVQGSEDLIRECAERRHGEL